MSAENQDALSRLAAFEAMLGEAQDCYAAILERMEKLRAEGKVKTATYRQLTSNKLIYQTLFSMYKSHGLIP